MKHRNLGWFVSYTGLFPAVVRSQGWSELPDGADVGAVAAGELVPGHPSKGLNPLSLALTGSL